MFSSFFFICLTILPLARCSTFLNPAFARYGTCREQTLSDDAAVKNYVPYATMALNSEKEKGYLGTIGILGGAVANTGPAYFAAMAALRVGADAVHIFCTNAVGLALQSLGPDIVVHPLIDVNHDLLMKRIEDMDVVVIGPGMPKEYGASAAVIYRVIDYCKAIKKPIVLDLDPIFLTASTLTHLQNYPSPGFIMIMNGNEFEVFYKLIKSPNSFSDGHIDVDFKKIGENFLIYRKGCTDTAFSTSLASSWSYSVTSSPRRTAGQGSIIAGASAVYFHWAIETLSANSTLMKVPMLPAAVATYQAARLMRDINSAAFQSKNRGAITSDMLKEIPNFLYGLTAELEV